MAATPRTERATGWWTENISDGGGHYGTRQSDGKVRAVCGREFVPEVNPFTRKAAPQERSADSAHACPACRAKRKT